MAIDIQYTKIPIFTDINDAPVEPTATVPGNGSHLINQYNYLVDEIEGNLNQLEDKIDTLIQQAKNEWVVIEEDYTVEGGEKIFIKNNQPVFPRADNKLYAPETPPLGTTFSYMSYNSSLPIELKNYNQQTLWANTGSRPVRAYSTVDMVLITFVYLGAGFNWFQVAGTPIIKTFGNS